MLKLGTIGTNWITEQFVDAAVKSKYFELSDVYSRTIDHAETFIKKTGQNNVKISTDLTDFFNRDFDVVYIASPNSLHFEQAKMAIKSNKHVIVEKPSFSNTKEFAAIKQELNRSNVYLFEAARHIYEPGFKRIESYVNENAADVTGATINYMKYSSRYDNVLNGEEPNVFSPKFSGGALYDLGVYPVYAAAELFGAPNIAVYNPEMIVTGVDGSGVANLKYDKFDVNLIFGKTKNSVLPSEIYLGKDTLVIRDNIGTIKEAGVIRETGDEMFDFEVNDNPMVSEAETFGRIIEEKNDAEYTRLLNLAEVVNEILFKLRDNAGIKFAADDK